MSEVWVAQHSLRERQATRYVCGMYAWALGVCGLVVSRTYLPLHIDILLIPHTPIPSPRAEMRSRPYSIPTMTSLHTYPIIHLTLHPNTYAWVLLYPPPGATSLLCCILLHTPIRHSSCSSCLSTKSRPIPFEMIRTSNAAPPRTLPYPCSWPLPDSALWPLRALS
jgi:hypothetical protein